MSYGLSLVAKKALLPGLAVVLGAMLYAPAMVVEDGACRSFQGGLSGNDPDAETTLVMCRCGDKVFARLRVEGQAGLSIGDLAGELKSDGRVIFSDMQPLVSQPNDGWTFCYDDVYELNWDPFAQRLSGTYRSEQCDDAGTVMLLRR